MSAKKLLFREEARDKIRRGVDTLAEAVKVTLGPRGRTVVLDREFGAPQIVNSGVVVAKSIELEDRFENMGAQLMREVAARTSEMAGDGTTTATVPLEDVAVLLYDQKLSGLQELVPLLESSSKAGMPLLVVAEEVDADALATLVVNSIRGVLKTCAVKAPGFGDRRKAMLEDIALVTGGQVVSAELGLTLEKAKLEHLGRARRVVVDKESTTIVGGAGDASAIRDRIVMLKKEREKLASDYDREKLDERIAKLSGGVAVIKVGAATETELKERKLRVEDALHATRAAIEEGIVPGGGVALLRARKALQGVTLPTLDEDSGLKIVVRALEEPMRLIVLNAAQEPSIVLDRVDAHAQPSFGYNAARCEYGDMLAMGVIDPAKVTRLALQNAGSIASLILTIDCMVADAPKKELPPPGVPSPDMF
ncbi:chaperonin GroL [Variovorax sp. HW608]|uniref:chaperonin GroEL n=1 Tax=Variovorax sp. HW608 TaxID=1034889 RepID=UPI00081FB6C4|nr:chaperonin GroEL [Variovorax sp. HW608]SCK58101.1 chaperonin GroL [Variovorax sp. HW608]